MIQYSTNWMGPVNADWIKKNGDDWAGGRIDVHGTGDPYGDELNLPIMKSEDYQRFSAWLSKIKTQTIWSFKELVALYEVDNPKITFFRFKGE